MSWRTIGLGPVLGLLLLGLVSTAATAALPQFVDLAREASPAVVNISTVKVVESADPMQRFLEPFQRRGSPFEEFFDQFFGQLPQKRREQALGSGFIISRDGYVVTNNHVVEKADEIQVILKGGDDSFPAEIVGRDPETDLALLKIEAERDLPTLGFGNSDQLQVGQWVMAIGNPFGLDHTVTAGIISAKGRVIGAGPYDNFLQTDASINPGNSGGPLLNMEGEVVGINTAIVAAGQGIGFAIPASMAEEIISELKSHGSIKRGWLGVSIQDVDQNTAKALGLTEAKGALVASVTEGDPADKAGIRPGDVIVAVNGTSIQDAHELTRTIGALPPEDKIKLTIWRAGKVKEVKVTLGERHAGMEPGADGDRGAEGPEALGMRLRAVTPEDARRLRLPEAEGLLVAEVAESSKAARANIVPGDVILEANGQKVDSLQRFRDVLQGDAADKGVILLLVYREGQTLFRTIPLED
ncbi:DegQ family serine endoprotease [Desulfovermiculus halophilus]|uniref:DegQ family serine endoprotease n=1 Tax=Desulfovermiculus halophilus TaxID=339722 RepID=UPI00048782E8|nr:DegQ family serine endoprotease [Desulfovermiculus halophilus]